MRSFVFLSLLFSSCAIFAADSGFNGRWDITVTNEPRRRAWWLEVQGAGTSAIKGRFVGFPGGNMDEIPKIGVAGGVLQFSWDGPAGKKNPGAHQEYTVRLAGKKIEGEMKQGDREMKFVGVRAPVVKDKDDSSWREGTPVEVFNGRDPAGWHPQVPGKESGWTVENGILTSKGAANNLETDGTWWNYKLHLEYKVGAKSNSGIGLRGRYEVQILEDYGAQPGTHNNGALYSRIPPKVNASKPAGEWQTYDIRLVGQHVTIVLNGQEVVKGEIEGLTAIATDADEAKPGPLVLQGDHGPVEFRKITLTPLTK